MKLSGGELRGKPSSAKPISMLLPDPTLHVGYVALGVSLMQLYSISIKKKKKQYYVSPSQIGSNTHFYCSHATFNLCCVSDRVHCSELVYTFRTGKNEVPGGRRNFFLLARQYQSYSVVLSINLIQIESTQMVIISGSICHCPG